MKYKMNKINRFIEISLNSADLVETFDTINPFTDGLGLGIRSYSGYIRQGYEQGRKDSIEKATEFSMAVPIMVLRDEFGFGQQRIMKFAAAFKELYESIDEKYLDLQDILKTIKEETGVEIVSRK